VDKNWQAGQFPSATKPEADTLSAVDSGVGK